MPDMSVFDMQVGMQGGAVPAARQAAAGKRSTASTSPLSNTIDNTPRFLGGLILGAGVTLFLLRAAGFRFSFGTSIGAGG